jgi:hypothetical protein
MPIDTVSLVRALVPAREAEGMLVVGLDRDGRISGVAVNPRHRALSFVKVWELGALADELDACALVVAVFPSRGGCDVPTEHERTAFADLAARAHRARIVLLDCVVVRAERCWSLRELAAEKLGA